MHVKLGDFLIKYREKQDISLRQMSSALGVSASFLSAIEIGKKKVPDSLYDRLVNTFTFTPQEQDTLKDAIALANGSVEIDLSGLNKTETEVSMMFARNFKNLSKENLLKIKHIMEEDEE